MPLPPAATTVRHLSWETLIVDAEQEVHVLESQIVALKKMRYIMLRTIRLAKLQIKNGVAFPTAEKS